MLTLGYPVLLRDVHFIPTPASKDDDITRCRGFALVPAGSGLRGPHRMRARQTLLSARERGQDGARDESKRRAR